MKFSRELKVGLIFILAIALLIWGFNFLKGKKLLSSERFFYARYQDVGGLEKSSPVYLNGLKIGHVSDVYFAPSMNGDIIIEMIITNKFPIPDNSIAKIFSEDLMGSRAIQIRMGNSTLMAETGDTLGNDIETSLKDAVNQQILPLKLKAEDLISSIDTMVVAIKGVFNKDVREEVVGSIRSIRHTFENLETTTEQLDTLVYDQSGRIASILYNLDMITRNLKENGDEIDIILNNLANLSDTLSHTNIRQIFENLNTSVNSISEITSRIQKGEGTLGMLITDDKLYNELEKAAREINTLAEDIRLNPKRYVRISVF